MPGPGEACLWKEHSYLDQGHDTSITSLPPTSYSGFVSHLFLPEVTSVCQETADRTSQGFRLRENSAFGAQGAEGRESRRRVGNAGIREGQRLYRHAITYPSSVRVESYLNEIGSRDPQASRGVSRPGEQNGERSLHTVGGFKLTQFVFGNILRNYHFQQPQRSLEDLKEK